MASKNNASRAEKVVSDAKKKTSSAKSASSKTSKKESNAKNKHTEKKPPKIQTEYENPIPAGAVVAIVSFFLCILFTVIAVKPEGALLLVIRSVMLGLVGRAGFYFSIPALFYLFFINTFGRKKAVTMRGICTILFAFLCGIIYHLMIHDTPSERGIQLVAELYKGGISGTTGGVLCGGAAVLLRWSCGTALSYLLTLITAFFVLLGAMQITIPSIIRAIANRPRDDWDDDDDYVEPAAVVVNHIANKKIEQKRQRREQATQVQKKALESAEERPESAMQKQARKSEENSTAASRQAVSKQKFLEAVRTEQQPQPELVQEPLKQIPGKGSAFMDRIDTEISAPLPYTGENTKDAVSSYAEEAAPTREQFEENPPLRMPELRVHDVKVQNEKRDAAEKGTSTVSATEGKQKKVSAKDTVESAQQVAEEIALGQAVQKPEYCFPPIELLKRPVRGGVDGTEEMRENSRRLNETLASFNIDAHIINVTRGPSVTRYEVELDKGVRLNKLTGCADDIALSLGASGVRIAAVPGKISVVGIEVPNRSVTTVSLREVIDSGEFAKAKSKSSIALGKSIDGNCVVGNIAKMPHLLIAGTTGSGKSVCMNSIIISLLYKAGPEDVKLIMVDPKMVELGIYNGIPQLLIPVVTDPKKAAGSLQWAVTEMLRRYKMMSDMGVRDLESYNGIVTTEEDGQKLPQIVIIIDELADLMMVAAKEVEDSICRIAQMGRAAGMHLIIATQRPSANVITGLMKANIPSRIAFSVASAMESRIILDTMGAEKLVGKGDMLYAPIGSGKPLRVQGCFVTDGEVEAVAEYVKDNYVADYNQSVLEEIEKKAQQAGKKPVGAVETDPNEEELEGDEMLPAAVDVILETGQASVSMLQRRLKLGYARAARIVDEMEEKGIVGPFQGSKPRAILISKEQWEAKKHGGTQLAFDDVCMNEDDSEVIS